jgi:hypothetical protein
MTSNPCSIPEDSSMSRSAARRPVVFSAMNVQLDIGVSVPALEASSH